MSGIFGIIHRNGRTVNREDLERMKEALAHRGPDGSGSWRVGPAGLGHLALHFTPESKNEPLPLEDPATGLVITADARLDNREELANQLGLTPGELPGTGDGRLILRAYEKWGRGCPSRLLGDFAFAVYDPRQRSLFCARDHAGVRPLFYHQTAECFVFASEIKAIRALPFVPSRMNEEILAASRLLPLARDPGRTLFGGIDWLPQAHCLQAGLEGASAIPVRYWDPLDGRRLECRTAPEYAECLRELVVNAVQARLRTSRPVGITLSGGLDSSAIACIAARHLAGQGRELHAFSSVLPVDHAGIESDERPYIQAVREQESNITVHYITAGGAGPFDGLEEEFARQESPAHAYHYMRTAMWQSAREHGVTGLLCGLGGDFMASYDGRDSLLRLTAGFRWPTAIRLFRELAGAGRQPATRQLIKGFIQPLISIRRLHDSIRAPFQTGASHLRSDLPVNPHFARQFLARPAIQIKRSRDWTDRSRILRKFRSDRLAIGKFNILLSFYQMESLYPFFDKRIVEFFMQVPPEQFILGGWPRSLFRRAMEGILPPAVQWRRDKKPFQPDFHARARASLPAAAVLLRSLPDHDPVHLYLDVPKIIRQLEASRPVAGRESWEPSTQRAVNGFILIRFLLWLRQQERLGQLEIERNAR